MEILVLLKRFEGYLENTKKLKKSSVQCYLDDISLFFRKIPDSGTFRPELFCEDNVNFVLLSLIKREKSYASIKRFMSSLSCFNKFLIKEGLCDRLVKYDAEILNAPGAAKPPKPEQSGTLSELDIAKIMAQPSTGTFKGLRDRAMLELLYASTLKVNEILELNVTDINVFTGTITCRSQSGVKYAQIYPTAAAVLAEYISIYSRLYGVLHSQEYPLFINNQTKRLTRQGLWKIIKEYSGNAGIDTEVTPLLLRQSYNAHKKSREVADIPVSAKTARGFI